MTQAANIKRQSKSDKNKNKLTFISYQNGKMQEHEHINQTSYQAIEGL